MDISYLANILEKILHFEIFVLNQTPVTPASIIMFIIMMAIFYYSSRFTNRLLVNRLLSSLHIDEGTRYTMLRMIHYLIITIGAVVSFQFVGIDLSGLAVIFGLLSVGIGFGLQNVTSNFIAGLILLFERPIKIGDTITVGDTEGKVIDISIRSTMIRTLNNISIIVPNSDFIANNVINWSFGDPKIRLDLQIGVSYSSDLDKVLDVLRKIAEEHPKVLQRPSPRVLLLSFGDSSWNMELQVWIGNPQGHHIVRSEINCEIVRKFREHNIEIPFPQRDVYVKNPQQTSLNISDSV